MRLLKSVILCLASVASFAQSNIISNNKPLAFFNPALQWDSLETAGISLTVVANPLSETSNYNNYTGLAEFNLSDGFHMGAHVSRVESRLMKRDVGKIFLSYNYEMEQGNFISFGINVGMISDQVKIAEFNKVLAPTIHQLTDSVMVQPDLGLGVSYTNQNLTIGLGLSKINRPSFMYYPSQWWEVDPMDSLAIVKKDTFIMLGDQNTYVVPLRQNINIAYKWSRGSVSVKHYLHLSNISYDGYEFLGFQNFIGLGNGLNFGLGMYTNGRWSYHTSIGYAEANFGVEIGAFFKEEFEYDPDAPFIQRDNWPKVNSTGAYLSVGRIPSIEVSTHFSF